MNQAVYLYYLFVCLFLLALMRIFPHKLCGYLCILSHNHEIHLTLTGLICLNRLCVTLMKCHTVPAPQQTTRGVYWATELYFNNLHFQFWSSRDFTAGFHSSGPCQAFWFLLNAQMWFYWIWTFFFQNCFNSVFCFFDKLQNVEQLIFWYTDGINNNLQY